MTQSLFAFGIGVGSRNQQQQWLDVYYPVLQLNPTEAIAEALRKAAGTLDQGNATVELDADKLTAVAAALAAAGEAGFATTVTTLAESGRSAVACLLTGDREPGSVPEAYLKLHLLSHRLVRPHELNLAGLFGVLPNVAWTTEGAVDLAELPARQLNARLAGRCLTVNSVDKFPRLTDYVVPSGVRIADTARVRLGAYLGEGTTIMHEGFVNFNAGTEGPGMVEGRISAGVFVGKGSDLGGGCSTMGTLSGGNNVVISIGAGCLIGANAGVGIPLGDYCTVEAGLYITAGSRIRLLDAAGNQVETVKARELAGRSHLLFRRNSETGAVEALVNKTAIELNEALHKHN